MYWSRLFILFWLFLILLIFPLHFDPHCSHFVKRISRTGRMNRSFPHILNISRFKIDSLWTHRPVYWVCRAHIQKWRTVSFFLFDFGPLKMERGGGGKRNLLWNGRIFARYILLLRPTQHTHLDSCWCVDGHFLTSENFPQVPSLQRKNWTCQKDSLM